MREVYCNAVELNLSNGDKVNFTLMNHIDEIHQKPRFEREVTVTNNMLTATLLENDVLCKNSYYNLSLPNIGIFPFEVPCSPLIYENNKPLDLVLLLMGGCFKGLIDVERENLDTEYIKKFEWFLLHENPHFKSSEKLLTKRFIKYADTTHHQEIASDDICFAMDRALSQIGLENGYI